MKYLFLLWPEASHVLPTFCLAAALRQRGDEVVYAGLADFAAMTAARGYQYVPFFEDGYPLGSMQAWSERMARRSGPRHSRVLYADLIRRLTQPETLARLRRIHADVLLGDEILFTAHLAARQLGICAVNLATNLSSRQNPMTPPVTTGLLPPGGLASRLAAACAWRRITWPRQLTASSTRALFRRAGEPTSALDLSGEWGPRVSLPQLVLGPEALDFPRSCPAGSRVFAGACVDQGRPEPSFDWDRLDSRRKVVLCSLGTISHYYPLATAFLRRVIAALAGRRDLQLIVHVGTTVDETALGDIDGVIVARELPQLRLLERASLLISHGGFGSLREAAYFGVPILACPVMSDQPGNAARVEYHRLGLRADFARVSIREIAMLVDRILADGTIAAAVHAMRERLRDPRPLAHAVRWLRTYSSSMRPDEAVAVTTG
jgi:zeaxanthin glucosyltransferase